MRNEAIERTAFRRAIRRTDTDRCGGRHGAPLLPGLLGLPGLPGLLVLLVLGSAVSPLAAQRPVSERVAAPRDATVVVKNLAGSVRVIGWDELEVVVEGTLGDRVERLELTAEEDEVLVRVVVPERVRTTEHADIDADLVVRMPAAGRLEAQTVTADLAIENVSGALTLNTVRGDIEVRGLPLQVMAESVMGDVDVEGARERIEARSTRGDVTVDAGDVVVEASTVTGDLSVHGRNCGGGGLKAVSGAIRFVGDLAGARSFSVENVNGLTEIRLPSGAPASFQVQSMKGEIENELGPPAERSSRYGPGKKLVFVVGSGGPTVEIRSLNGDIRIRKQ